MLISKNGQSFDWQDEHGKTYPDDCPYFEGKEIFGKLNANNEVEDYELSVYINDGGVEKSIIVPLSELFGSYNRLSALAKRGLIIKPRNAKDAFAILQNQAQALMKHATIKHTRLGFANINGQNVFLQEQNTVGIDKYVYDGKIKLHRGNRQDYEDFLRTTVFKSKNLTLAYLIGMSAPVMSLLVNDGTISDKTIVVNFTGKSSTGKSTSARLALSPFGNPSFGRAGLGITHNATENSIYGALVGVHGMPRVLDDINQNTRLDMQTLIYAIVASEPKRRLGDKFQENISGWSGTVVVTTETPIIFDTTKGGAQARALTLEMSQWTSSKEEAELINNVVQKHYGCMGEDFVAHLLNDIDYLEERFEEIRNEVDSKITVRDSLTGRISAQIAAIALTVDCYLKYYPNAFEWLYLDLIQPFIDSEQKMVCNRDAGENVLNLVREFTSTYREYFDNQFKGGTGHNSTTYVHKPYGKIVYYYNEENRCYKQVVYIYSTVFEELMIDKRFNDYKAGLRLLKERGALKCDKERLQTKIRGIRAYGFILDAPNETDDDNDTNEDAEC